MMHFVILICICVSSIFWANWRDWRRYLPTMYFMSFFDLLYLTITEHYRLWQILPDFAIRKILFVEFIYVFIVFPLTVFIFLSRYPKTFPKIIFHYIQWISLYWIFELIAYHYNNITYDHGWNIWWSLLFDTVMFPMLRLHYDKPLLAIGLSICFVAIYIAIFRVPLI
jgi:hypothetical protein